VKPGLVLALGNPLAGDDGVGWLLAERLAADAQIRREADVVCAGTDVYRCSEALAGRQRVVIIDAALSAAADLRVRTVAHPPPAGERRSSAPALDPVAAVSLLRELQPELQGAEIWWVLLDVPEIALGVGLSAGAARQLPEAVEAVRQLLLGDVPATAMAGSRAAS
jgi:hydrogenase maturation protease